MLKTNIHINIINIENMLKTNKINYIQVMYLIVAPN